VKDWGDGNDQAGKRDPVTRPDHYVQGSIEVLDAILGLELDYLSGNVLKYIARFRFKNGRDDLAKARQYITLMLENYDKLYGKDADVRHNP